MARIAVVTPYFPTSTNPSGGRSAYETLKELRRYADVQVIVPTATYPRWEILKPRSYLYTRPSLDYSPSLVKAKYLEYPAIPIVTRPINGFVCASRIRRQIEEYRPDLILNYWLYPQGFAAVMVARRLKIPSVVCAIGSDIRRIPDPLTRWFTLRTLHRASAVLTVSRELRDRVIGLGVPPGKAHAVLNGCDFSIFHPMDRSAVRAALGLQPDTKLILYVGTLKPSKGLRELKQAFLQLRAQDNRVCLAILGAGPLRPELEGAGIRFLGVCDADTVARWMNAADVLTLPSYSEGCPNVVVEALSCGRPVVATNVGGIPEVLGNDCGILVPPADVLRLAEGLRQSLSQSWNSEAISRSSRREWGQVAAETWEVCRSLLPGA